MDKQIATAALQFLQRLTLTGAEVPAFVAVTNAISAIANGSVVMGAPPPQPELRSVRPAIAARAGEE